MISTWHSIRKLVLPCWLDTISNVSSKQCSCISFQMQRCHSSIFSRIRSTTTSFAASTACTSSCIRNTRHLNGLTNNYHSFLLDFSASLSSWIWCATSHYRTWEDQAPKKEESHTDGASNTSPAQITSGNHYLGWHSLYTLNVLVPISSGSFQPCKC